MRKVSYLYNDSITNYHFSKEHPMKTKRIKMAHSLIQTYELSEHLNMFQSKEASRDELILFHDPPYIDYLEKWVTGNKKDEIVSQYKDD
jgi:histone deacetylase 1/2